MKSVFADTEILVEYSDRLDLLQDIYAEIVLAPKVLAQLLENRNFRTRKIRFEIQTGHWLRFWKGPIPALPDGFETQTIGESTIQTILLAKNWGVNCLLDDECGQTLARYLGVGIISTIGILETHQKECLRCHG